MEKIEFFILLIMKHDLIVKTYDNDVQITTYYCGNFKHREDGPAVIHHKFNFISNEYDIIIKEQYYKYDCEEVTYKYKSKFSYITYH